MAAQIVPPVEPIGIRAQQPAHSGHQIAFRRLDHQVKMVFHQAKGMNLKTGLLAGLGQGLEEVMAIAIIPEQGFPAVSPIEQMIDRPGIFNACLTRHKRHPAAKKSRWQASKHA